MCVCVCVCRWCLWREDLKAYITTTGESDADHGAGGLAYHVCTDIVPGEELGRGGGAVCVCVCVCVWAMMRWYRCARVCVCVYLLTHRPASRVHHQPGSWCPVSCCAHSGLSIGRGWPWLPLCVCVCVMCECVMEVNVTQERKEVKKKSVEDMTHNA